MNKKTAKLKKNTVQWNLASVILVAVFCVTLINQGGFYEGAIVFAGIIMACFLFAKGIKVRISVTNILFAIFSAWYFFCSVKNGFVTEYAIRGLLPFTVFMFSVYVSECGQLKASIITSILKISAILALIASLHCVIMTIQSKTVIRLLLPFNYSNVSGIYFAVCWFLSEKSNDNFLKKAKIFFPIAVILTLSVGAMALSLLLIVVRLIREKKIKQLIVLILLLIAAVFLLHDRIIQSGGTFLERMLQIHDGFLCIIKNPISGIGAGSWGIVKQQYQTGFYAATVLHSSIVQIGVNSGLPGFLMFVALLVSFLKDAFCKKLEFVLSVMIILHSTVDFTFSFAAMGFLLVILASPERKTEDKTLPNSVKSVLVVLFVCIFAISAYGLSEIKTFQNSLKQNKLSEKTDVFVSHSAEASRSCAAYMNGAGKAVPKNMFALQHLSTEMIINEACFLKEDESLLIKCLQKQPYNVKLMQFIEENCSLKTIEKANIVREKAIASLSPIGEILYNLKGENQ